MDPPLLAAFDDECAALYDVLQALSSDDFDRPTNCPPWTLHELVVHIAFSIGLPDRLRDAAADLSGGTAADYFRRPERDTTEYRSGNVDRTREVATTVDRRDVARRFADTWKHSSTTFASAPSGLRVERSGRAYSLEAFLVTRLMSVAAHGVDVAITLGRPTWTTQAALDALRPLLDDLLGRERPSSWNDQYFLEVGTGRRPLSEDDRRALGDAARRFPLLS
jgi:uncharacterized protein (TIGR03083 family)